VTYQVDAPLWSIDALDLPIAKISNGLNKVLEQADARTGGGQPYSTITPRRRSPACNGSSTRPGTKEVDRITGEIKPRAVLSGLLPSAFPAAVSSRHGQPTHHR
jgi:hypothetical protein